MNIKILYALFLLLSLKSFSQATAYNPSDLAQCENQLFDLTINNNFVLGNQDPAVFTVTYFELEADAVVN